MQEEIIKKKYGGLLPKKPPLISKVIHIHCFHTSLWILSGNGIIEIKIFND